METLHGLKRTHRCAELSEKNIGESVTVMGWTQTYRQLGALTFINLRMMMRVFAEEVSEEAFKKAQTVRENEFVLAACGKVVKRSSVNNKIPTGQIEIQVEELRILNKSETPPFAVEENSSVKDEIRLKYRYLDLRRPDISQKNLIVRHKIAQLARNFYSDNGFMEIETPVLIKSTPEGARDYLVPEQCTSRQILCTSAVAAAL